MSRQITYEVIADGGTDRALVPIIEWAIHRLDSSVEILEPEFRKRKGSVSDYIASHRSSAMLTFVHRDAERDSVDTRLREFKDVPESVVPVIPVRMSEAWLLVCGEAIARAADRPEAQVNVPPPSSLESIVDPKASLESLLLEAAGDLTGRRRKKFLQSIVTRRVSVATYTRDFTPLEDVDAFARFQAALALAYPYGPKGAGSGT